MNTVCKEQKGDLVWGDDRNVKFVPNENGKFKLAKTEGINFKIEPMEVCKEHEWEEITETEYLTITLEVCKKCHANKFPTAFKRSAIDFKVPENLEVINKQQWEDIWDKFIVSDEWKNSSAEHLCFVFITWLKENYFCPEKKNT